MTDCAAQAQTVLYKVHKSLVAPVGERFADILARPPPGGGLGTEEDPIILTDFGVSSKSFDALLSVVYVSYVTQLYDVLFP